MPIGGQILTSWGIERRNNAVRRWRASTTSSRRTHYLERTPMTENRVFACSWKADGDRIRAWVRAIPRIAVDGASFAEADERLYQAIMRATGDGENSREYSPLPPAPRTNGLLSVLRFLSPLSHAVALTSAAELYASVCAQCGYSTGIRNAAPLAVRELPANVDAFRAGLGRPAGANGRALCVSSEFLDLLDGSANPGLEWREIERPRRARRRFFELVSGRGTGRLVALAGANVDAPWQCDTCGLRSPPFHHAPSGEPMKYVVFDSGAVGNQGDWHTVEVLRAPYLMVAREAWGELSGKKGARGIQSYDVGVVDPKRVDPTPRVVLRSTWPRASHPTRQPRSND